MEIPDEIIDECVSIKKCVSNVCPKSSKLCNDKGSVKPQDLEDFGYTQRCKSFKNITLNLESDAGDATKVTKKGRKRSKARKRVKKYKTRHDRKLSDPHEFSLLPLMRKTPLMLEIPKDRSLKADNLQGNKSADVYPTYQAIITMNDVEAAI